jgi:hypothetical protein
MTVAFMRWPQRADTIQAARGIAVAIGNDVIAPLHCEEFTPVRAEIATAAPQQRDHRQMITSALRTREGVQALRHGGAIH